MLHRIKASYKVVVQQTWSLIVTMLGAATMAIFRRNIPGAPCVPAEEDECEVPRGRWGEAVAILRAGFREARRTASQGVEAIKLENELYSAQVRTACCRAPMPSLGPLLASLISYAFFATRPVGEAVLLP